MDVEGEPESLARDYRRAFVTLASAVYFLTAPVILFAELMKPPAESLPTFLTAFGVVVGFASGVLSLMPVLGAAGEVDLRKRLVDGAIDLLIGGAALLGSGVVRYAWALAAGWVGHPGAAFLIPNIVAAAGIGLGALLGVLGFHRTCLALIELRDRRDPPPAG